MTNLGWLRFPMQPFSGLLKTDLVSFSGSDARCQKQRSVPPRFPQRSAGKACRLETGQTTIQYLTGLRMSRAKELLEQTTYKIGSIANAAGFPDEKHFLRVFKKAAGFTPTQWRTRTS